MSKNDPLNQYAEKDFVQVTVEGAEEPLPDPVPKSWVGTDLLPPNVVAVKQTRARAAAKSDDDKNDSSEGDKDVQS